GLSMARSATVLIAAVIGGTGTFFGPAAGAVVLTALSVVVAGVSRAWALYLGVLFVAVVVAAPGGIAGVAQTLVHALRRDVPAAERWRVLCGVGACMFWGVAIVCAAELGYAWRFAQDDGAGSAFGAWGIDADAPAGWIVACSAAGVGGLRGRGRLVASRLGIGWIFQQTSPLARLSVFDNLRCAARHAPDERRRWWNRLRESASVDRAAARGLHDIGLAARRDAPAGE